MKPNKTEERMRRELAAALGVGDWWSWDNLLEIARSAKRESNSLSDIRYIITGRSVP